MADGSIKINTKIQDQDLKKQISGLKAEIGTGMKSAVRVANRALAGMAAGVAGVAVAARKFTEVTTELQNMANMAGVGVESFQALEYAGSRYGVTQDAMSDGLKELQLRADEFAETGSGPAAEAFERIGYTAEQTREGLKDTEGMFIDIIGRMEGMEQAAQIRIADELFGGQAGERFIEMINEGSASVQEMATRAREMGMVMDAEVVSAGREMGRAFDDVRRVLTVLAADVFAELSGGITEAAQGFAEWATEGNRLRDIIVGIVDTVRFGFESGIIPTLVATVAAIKGAQIAMIAFNTVAAANPLGVVAVAAVALVAAFRKLKGYIDEQNEKALTEEYGDLREQVNLTAQELKTFDEQLNTLGSSGADTKFLAEQVEAIASDYGISVEEAAALVRQNDQINDEVADHLDTAREIRIERERAAMAEWNSLRSTEQSMQQMNELYNRHRELAEQRAEERRAQERADEKAEARSRLLGDLTERLVRLDNLRSEGAIGEIELIEDKLKLREQMIDKIKQEAVEGNITEAEAAQMIAAQRVEVERYVAELERLNEQMAKTADGMDNVEKSGAEAGESIGSMIEGWRERSANAADDQEDAGESSAMALITGFTTRLQDGAHQAMSAATDFMEGIGGAVMGGLGVAFQIAQAAWDILMAVFEFDPKEALGDLENFLGQIETFFYDTLGSLPIFFDAGVEMIMNMIEGLLDNLPNIVKTMVNVLDHILNSIIDNAPMVIDGAITIIFALIEGLLSMLPEIITAAATIVTSLATALLANTPKIIAAIIEMLPEIVATFILLIPMIVQAVMAALPQLIEGILLMIPAIISALVMAIPQILGAVLQAFVELIAALVQGIVPWFQDLGDAIWNGLIMGFVNAFERGKQAMYDIFEGLIKAVMSIFGMASPSKVFADIGRNIIQGLINGIKGLGGAIWSKVKGVFTGLWNNVKSFFSKAKEMGASIGNGIANGIKSAAGAVAGAAGGLMDGIKGLGSGIVDTAKGIGGAAVDTAKGIGDSIAGFFGFAVGTPWIPSDQMAMVHQGERIVPKTFNQDLMSGNTMMLSPEALAQLVAGVRQASGMGSTMVAPEAGGGNNVIQLHAYMDGRIDIDGEAIGRAAFEYIDEQAGVAFGN